MVNIKIGLSLSDQKKVLHALGPHGWICRHKNDTSNLIVIFRKYQSSTHRLFMPFGRNPINHAIWKESKDSGVIYPSVTFLCAETCIFQIIPVFNCGFHRNALLLGTGTR